MIDPVSIGVICTAAGAAIGAISKSVADNARGIRQSNLDTMELARKTDMDQLQVAIAQVARLQLKIDVMQQKQEAQEAKILELTVHNVTCTLLNTQFAKDITELQRQLTAMGSTPIVSPPNIAPVSTTLVPPGLFSVQKIDGNTTNQ